MRVLQAPIVLSLALFALVTGVTLGIAFLVADQGGGDYQPPPANLSIVTDVPSVVSPRLAAFVETRR